jgi:hypothetical protein
MPNRNFRCSFCSKIANLREGAWGHKISYCKQFDAFVDDVMEFDYEYAKWMLSNLDRIGVTLGSLLSSKTSFSNTYFYEARSTMTNEPLYENLYYVKNIDISFFKDSQRGLTIERLSNNAPDKNNPSNISKFSSQFNPWRLRSFLQGLSVSFETFNFMDDVQMVRSNTREEFENIIVEYGLQKAARCYRKIFDNWKIDYYGSLQSDECYFLRKFLGSVLVRTSSSYGLRLADNIEFSNATLRSKFFIDTDEFSNATLRSKFFIDTEAQGSVWTVSARSNKKISYTKEQHNKKRKCIEKQLKQLKGEYSIVFYN